MFFLHIRKKTYSSLKKKEIEEQIFFKKQLIKKTQLLYLFKKTKKIKNLNSILEKTTSSENLIKYTLGVSLSNKNISVYIADIQGKIIKSFSAGFLGLNGKQKTKKTVILIKLLKLLLTKVKLLESTRVTLHLKNIKKFNISLILSLLKKYLTIELIRIFNNKPHNGCRPKKLKRKKKRKVFFK